MARHTPHRPSAVLRGLAKPDLATALSPAHRAWRVRVFAATWLSYVGFYFCRKPFSAAKSALGADAHWSATTLGNIGAAYYVAYALGQFLASYVGTRLGPRRNVLLGMTVSIAATVAMTQTFDARLMMALMVVLGLAQATGWSGNVGAMAGWFHKHERGKVMGAWSTNFNVGSLVAGWVMAGVLGAATPAPWRWCFYVGAMVLAAIWIQFFVLERDRPEDVGLEPIEDPTAEPEPGSDRARARARRESTPLSRDAWINILLVGGFYFFAKFIRYAIWSWAPFFLHEHYALSQSHASLGATAFDFLGLPGVYLTGWASDRFAASRRAGVSTWMMLCAAVAVFALFELRDASVVAVIALLALIGFTCYGPDALLTGAGAIDIGGRRNAVFAAAVISGFGSLGSVVQELVIARVYDPATGNLGTVFALLLGNAVLAVAFCVVLVVRNRRGGRGI